MVKHTQIIRRQKLMNCLSVFDLFVRFALKGLILNGTSRKTKIKQKICAKLIKRLNSIKIVKRHPKPCIINTAQRVARPFPLQSTKNMLNTILHYNGRQPRCLSNS